MGVRPAADQDSAMLQTDSNFSQISMICPFPGGIASMNGLTKGSRAAVVVDLYQKFFARYV
jgi:hypothetical protein